MPLHHNSWSPYSNIPSNKGWAFLKDLLNSWVISPIDAHENRPGKWNAIKILKLLSNRVTFLPTRIKWTIYVAISLQIVTAYYRHGSVNNLNRLLQKPEFSQYNNIQTRFQLIVDYVKIINYLHNSPIGTRVMCDTDSLRKLLMQYLITDDFHLVVNDLDNTPDAREENGILCTNKKELLQFVAPEQRWPFNESVPFRSDLKPTYDEKIDIWKIPPFVERILGDVNGSSLAKSKLQRVMERCRAIDPQQRPTANEVLQRLLRVQRLIKNNLFDPW